MNKAWLLTGVLALGALGLALVLNNQPKAKTLTLEPSKVFKTAKPGTNTSSVKAAGSLQDLTRDAPEPRAVTTDAVVVPQKPSPNVQTSTQTSSSPKPETTDTRRSEADKPSPTDASPTSVSANQTPNPAVKAAPEIASANQNLNSGSQSSSMAPEKPTGDAPASGDPAPQAEASLPLRRDNDSVSIQAGAFKSADNAEGLRAQLTSQGFDVKVELGTDGISRVIVGPYPNEQTARDAASKISNR